MSFRKIRKDYFMLLTCRSRHKIKRETRTRKANVNFLLPTLTVIWAPVLQTLSSQIPECLGKIMIQYLGCLPCPLSKTEVEFLLAMDSRWDERFQDVLAETFVPLESNSNFIKLTDLPTTIKECSILWWDQQLHRKKRPRYDWSWCIAFVPATSHWMLSYIYHDFTPFMEDQVEFYAFPSLDELVTDCLQEKRLTPTQLASFILMQSRLAKGVYSQLPLRC